MGTTSTGNFRSLVRVSQVLSQVSVPVILIGITYFLKENGYHIWVDGQYVRGRRTVCKRGDGQYVTRGDGQYVRRGTDIMYRGRTLCKGDGHFVLGHRYYVRRIDII